jgi:hypothetical protein
MRITGAVIDVYANGAWNQVFPPLISLASSGLFIGNGTPGSPLNIDVTQLGATIFGNVSCADIAAALNRCGLNQTAASGSPSPAPSPAPSPSYTEMIYFTVHADDGSYGSGGFSMPPTTYYSIVGTGVTSSDFNPSYDGIQGTVNPTTGQTEQGTMVGIPSDVIALQVANDGVTEGVESFTFELYANSARTQLILTGPTVTISDGSVTWSGIASTNTNYNGTAYSIAVSPHQNYSETASRSASPSPAPSPSPASPPPQNEQLQQ